MGVLLSSCAPSLHSKITFLKENYKDFEINNGTAPSCITKINNNLEPDIRSSISNYGEYWKSNKFAELNSNSDMSDITDQLIQPKNMPRYDFSTLKNDSFLDEASSEKIINVSVVLMRSVFLEGTYNERIYLPLGTVLDVITRKDNWLYVRTVDGQRCYVDYEACVPLGIFSLASYENNASSNNLNYDCTVAPEKISNMLNLNDSKLQCSERDFDLLYLRLTRKKFESKKQCNECTIQPLSQNNVTAEQRTVILIIKTDYTSNAKNTLKVRKGDIVFLIHCCVKGWFWVRNENNVEGFVPAATAGYWCS